MEPSQPDHLDDLGRSQQLRKLAVLWRKRLVRSKIPGLPARGRGAVTQEDLAHLCGMTTNHYGNLERGSINPGYREGTLDAFASGLQLSDDERRALYLLANGKEPPPQQSYAPLQITPALAAHLHRQPWPTVIVNTVWDVLACNDITLVWFPYLKSESNVMRAIFLHPECRHQLVDWEKVHAPRAIAQLRARFAQLPNNPELKELISDIVQESTHARQLWDTNPSVRMHDDGYRCAIWLPGADKPTVVERVSVTPGRNSGLRVTAIVPVGGYVPQDCHEHHQGDAEDEGR